MTSIFLNHLVLRVYLHMKVNVTEIMIIPFLEMILNLVSGLYERLLTVLTFELSNKRFFIKLSSILSGKFTTRVQATLFISCPWTVLPAV